MTMHAGPVHLAGSALDHARHVCAFFHNRDEEYRVLMPFIAEGFDHGDRAFHIVDPNHRSDHMERLRDGGIPTESAEASGQLTVLRWEDAYLRDGHFDQGQHGVLIEEVLTAGKTQGFPLTRLVANMDRGDARRLDLREQRWPRPRIDLLRHSAEAHGASQRSRTAQPRGAPAREAPVTARVARGG